MGRRMSHAFTCSHDQFLLQKPDERCFADSTRTNHEHHSPKPVQTRSLSWRANGLQDSITGLQQIHMFNGTFLFNPGEPLGLRLRKKHRITPLWSAVLLFVFFHQRSRLKTRKVSPSAVACRAVNFNGSCLSS